MSMQRDNAGSESLQGAWFPLSAAQQSRWFLYQFDPVSRGNHNNVFVAGLNGKVDSAVLQRALDTLVARHPMLRARFDSDQDGQPRQRVLGPQKVALQQVDMSGVDDAALMTQVEAGAWKSFPLDAPLLRVVLFRRSAERSVLLFALDHLICDGWSYWQLLEEFGGLLAGDFAADEREHGDFHGYADFVRWQREWIGCHKAEKQFAYWEKTLSEDLPALHLPFDRPRPTHSSGRQAVASISLSAELTGQLRRLAARSSGSLFTGLLAAFQILLHRYSGQDAVVVGAPMPGRTRPEWERVVGDFVNMVALRNDFSPASTVADALRSARSSALRGMRNQDYPFSRLVERLHSAPGGDSHPFFQAAFVFQKARRGRELAALWNADTQGRPVVRWGEIELQAFPMPHRVANDRIALALHAMEIDDHVRCDFTYDVDVFDAATVERLTANFRVLVEAMIGCDPHDKVAHLPVLAADERRQLLEGFNAIAALPASGLLVHQRFEWQAAARPDATALRCDDESISYAVLNRRANRIAARLRELGVGPDDRVGVCLPRGPALVAGLLGILKAGGAYVPLDPHYPVDRLAFMLADAAPRVMLVDEWPDGLQPPVGTVLLAPGDAALERYSDADPDPGSFGLEPCHLAYVIYTSGSTGQPKGVAIEHRNTQNLLEWALSSFTADELASTLFATSINFDLAVYELFVPLSAGHAVVLVDDILALDAQSPVTLVNTVPSGIGAVLDNAGVPATVRLINLAGEALKPRLVERILATTNVDAVANLYGPTETTTYSTWTRIARGDVGPINIGRPIANTRIYIVDPQLQPVPIGALGEICIGGAGVARGYLGRPQLTAERFVPDPFADAPLARMYRTGDLGRWKADGSIDYVGRNDFQVKIRGFRVELGEIETRLAACAGVRDVVVVARDDDGPAGQRLVAYLLAEADRTPSIETLRAALAREVASYMIPSGFMFLDAWPLTPNGKLDRSALPAPSPAALPRCEFEAPVGAVEQAIAEIWQELLGLDQVGRRDHFFELGGNSLLALRSISRQRLALGVEVALREHFAQPTLAGLAEVVAQAKKSSEAPIPVADRSGSLPLSWAQQRLWFMDRLNPAAGAAYHMPAALQMQGCLRRDALTKALNRIVARHESLRTCFVVDCEQPQQLIAAADCGLPLLDHDLTALDPTERQVAVAEISATEATARFDLATGPLIRGRLLKLATDHHILLLTQHHIVSDGWSIGVLVREFSALYEAYCAGELDPLPALPIQYQDYAIWQRQQLQGDALNGHVDFWRAQLDGAPALLELPTDRPRPALQSHIGGTAPVVLSARLAAAVRALARRTDTTVFMVLLAAWSTLLSRLSGQEDVVVGTPVANRQRPETEGLIGFFVNSLALRVRFDGEPTSAQLLQRIRSVALDAFEHQGLPFEQVVEAVQPQRSLAHAPLFQTMLALDNTPGSSELQLPDLQVAPLPVTQRSTRVDLTLAITASGDALRGELEYASDLFDVETVARLAARFVRLLGAMTSDEHVAVSRLPLLDDDERTQLLRGLNATAVDYPSQMTIAGRFAEQVVRAPDAVALIDDEGRLSYAELNRQANRIAHRLLQHGLRLDDRVAIVAERSTAMLVGMLGVLKAGGAYLPVDPSLPAERQSWLLADSGAAVVLTDRSASSINVDCPRVDLDQRLAVDLPATDPCVPGLGARNLAYVLYTSGSTGEPKGVMIEQRSVLRLVVNTYAPIEADDCVAHCANPAFDASTWEIWAPLLNGARLRLVPPATLLDRKALCRVLIDDGVTALLLTSGLFNEYIDALAPAFGQLKYLMTGGDAMDPRAAARVMGGPLRPRHLINVYGPTEATTFASTYDVPADHDPEQPVSIGPPIGNTRIHIVDRHGEPLPIGVCGEILVGGPGVARGYLNRPELTAERFIPDRFGSDPDARLYRTGDLGCWLSDGSIRFAGRNDFQIKLRGFRIELGEIEAALGHCIGVRDAVVVARADAAGDKRLLAYVLPNEGATPGAADLRGQLASHLPGYMLPSAITVMEAFPLTVNGKVDRKALPDPDRAAATAQEWEAPVGEYERALADIWQQLLGIERVGRHDHFFDLGGHSLLVMRLVTRVRAKFHIELPLGALFEHPVLSALADLIRTLQLELFLDDELHGMQDELDGLNEAELLEILKQESINE